MSSDDKETDKYNGTYPEIVTPPCSYYTNLNMIVPIILLYTNNNGMVGIVFDSKLVDVQLLQAAISLMWVIKES